MWAFITDICKKTGTMLLSTLKCNIAGVNDKDCDWLNVHGLYVKPDAKNFGIGTLLLRTVIGIGLANHMKGVGVDDPYYFSNQGFYKHKGMNLFSPGNSCYQYGSAELELIFENGEYNTTHRLLPDSLQYPLQFQKIRSPDLLG